MAPKVEPRQEDIIKKVELGLWLCPHYILEDPAKLAPKIYSKDKLPAFTFIDVEDVSQINKARANLFSLLMPIHSRETALEEFVEVALKWAELMERPDPSSEIWAFYHSNLQKQSAEQRIREYTRENFYYQIVNQGLRRLRSPEDSYPLRQPFQDLFFAILEIYTNQKNDDFRRGQLLVLQRVQDAE